VTFGVAPITLAATGGASGNAIVFSVVSGPGTISGSKLTVTGVGTIQIAANQAGNTNYTAAAQVTQSVVVNKAVPTVALQSSNNPALVQSSVTLTAIVSSTVTAPTGSVTFVDGSNPLGISTITGGVATLTTASLAVGSHSITAVYSGDANFASITSSTLTQTIEDFSVSIATGDSTSLTLLPGGTGTFTLTMSPSGAATFPSTVTLTLSGLPSGATYSFSPTTLAAGAGTTTVTLTIQLPQAVAVASPLRIDGKGIEIGMSSTAQLATPNRDLSEDRGRKLAPLTLAILLLPFAGGLRSSARKLRRAFLLLLLIGAAVGTIAGLGGCGSSGSGFFAQAPQTYTLTVTGTSGTLSRSANLTLTVE
jgi:hypothetical protein